MNGAQILVQTLLNHDINLCFANPGTSEMHFVAALDQYPEMRCILGLFEGGVTGAADGYYRMSHRVAATMLHLGPGLGNGWANLHNGRKARSGILNIVGDHATWHSHHPSPLNSDILGLAHSISDWVHRSISAEQIAGDCRNAIEAARTVPGQIATLILPADTAWTEVDGPILLPPAPPKPLAIPPEDEIKTAAAALQKGETAGLYVGDRALLDGTLELAARIAAKTGCKLIGPFRSGRIPRGAGRVQLDRLTPSVAINRRKLAGISDIVLVGTIPPAAFFAYPDLPSLPFETEATVQVLAEDHMNLHEALQRLAVACEALNTPIEVAPFDPPALPHGELTKEKIGLVLGALIPEQGIIVDESITSGRTFGAATLHAQPHDWLQNTGGAIGQGLPNAVGAALACPDRQVICLMGDGAAMYTIQSLWTMARENLNVTIVIFANKGYQVLRQELMKVGITEIGKNAVSMLEVDHPTLDWVMLAKGHGVDAGRADSVERFVDLFRHGLAQPGPFLIEAAL